MSGEPMLPSDLEELDRRLKEVRFEPRASLGPEIMGRLRQGESAARPPRSWRRRQALAGLAATLVLVAGTALVLRRSPPVLVDRCCYDLDGGGQVDDGVILLADRDSRVHRLRLYEDRDRSGTFSAGDVVRFDRGEQPAMRGDVSDALVTTQHCCVDLDGGGPDDDALLVIGVPPDRVMMAAIYERRPGGRQGDWAAGAFRLR